MFDRRMHKELFYFGYWLSVYVIIDLTLRSLVEGSQLPSVTWEQSGSSAEETNLSVVGGT